MKTVAIIQARMGSSRLPGKVLRQLCGRSVLAHVVSRVRLAKRLDGIMVATTEEPGDDQVVRECGYLAVPYFRGSEQDVLSRYFGAAQLCEAEVIVRVTADSPLFDGVLLDEMLTVFQKANGDKTEIDYLSNVIVRTYPNGLSAEIFTMSALARAHREAKESYEREHVTPYFYEHPAEFRLQSFESDKDRSTYRWTLDTPEDWEFIAAVYQALGANFTTTDVFELLEARPELLFLNAGVKQKAIK